MAVRTHWFEQEKLKFSASQLAGLNLSSHHQQDFYWQLYASQAGSSKDRIRSLNAYWREQAVATSDPSEAYRFWFAMGWDVGSTSMELYREVLAKLRDSAMEAGQAGRSRLAALHWNKLQRQKG